MSTISGSTSEMSALSCFGHCSTQQQSQSVTSSPSCTYQLEKHVQIKMAAFDSAITDVSCTLSIIWSFTRSQFPTPISMFYIYCLYCRYNCHWNRREDIPVTYIFAMVMATSKMVKDHEQFRGLLVSRTYVSRFFNSFRCTSELNLKRQLQMGLSTWLHFGHPLCNLTGLLRVAFRCQIFQAIDSHLADDVSYTNLRSNTNVFRYCNNPVIRCAIQS